MSKSQTLLEVGCGEGYYIGNLSARRQAQHYFGLDVAKAAIRMAAKRHKNGRFLVADLNQFIPLAEQSIDLLLNIFAPRHVGEFWRVLQPNGWLLIIIPHPDHLASLRQPFNLLNIAPNKPQTLHAQFGRRFTHRHTHTIRFPLTLPASQLHHLLQMMPSARHHTATWPTTLSQQPVWQTEAAFQLLTFQKTAVSPTH